MALRTFQSAALAVTLLLGGCSTISDWTSSIFSSSSDTADDTGEIAAPEADQGQQASTPVPGSPLGQKSAQSQAAPQGPSSATLGNPSGAGSSTFTTTTAPRGAASGTFVGQKVASLRGDLAQLQGRLSSQAGQMISIRTQTERDSETYHGTVAAIQSRLQLGTTPGNPILTQQWTEAQGELGKINADVQQMNDLTQQVASTSAMAGYLLDSVRAARSLAGGVDEDFRQLTQVEDQTNTTSVGIDRLLGDLATAIQRQQVYVANERGNLNILALAIQSGQMYSNGSSYQPAAVSNAPAPFAASPLASSAPTAFSAGQRPLVVIRFDRANVAYQDALYTAVKAALDRSPGASFNVVAVTQSGSAASATTARRNAEQVARVITEMGLPAQRVNISTATSGSAGPGEVQVFVR